MLGIWGSLAAHRFEGPVLSWREPWAGSQETGAVPGVVFDLVHVLKLNFLYLRALFPLGVK